MRFTSTAALALTSVIGVSASPIIDKRQAAMADIDPTILQFALTLEHLENAFYKKALSTWDQKSFTDAGFSPMFYDELKYIAHDEEGHVVYLEAGLTAAGASPVPACEYTFPAMTDAKSFVSLASVIEGVGVSAYLGAAPLVTSKAYLTAAGSILVTEALHQSATRGAVGEIPMANVFGTPMDPNAIFSIAAGFLKSCPFNITEVLPFTAYEALAVTSGMPTAPTALIALEPKEMPSGTVYATFVSGLDTVVTDAAATNSTTLMFPVPNEASGQSYVFLTKDNSGNLTASNIIAGPAIIEVTPSSPTFDLSIQ